MRLSIMRAKCIGHGRTAPDIIGSANQFECWGTHQKHSRRHRRAADDTPRMISKPPPRHDSVNSNGRNRNLTSQPFSYS